jgi:gamma-glutamyltranspeptidase/glutathione hydrolase
MDAAISAAAVLAVVEPAETGIGGDCFALYAPQGKMPPQAFNGSGRAPSAASAEWYQDLGFASIPDGSVHSVTYPGAVDAWCQLHSAFGRLDFAELMQPAIGYARNGYVVHERVAQEWRASANRLDVCSTAQETFLLDGGAPAPGAVMMNPALARTLEAIAKNGRDGFYEGEIADAMVSHLRGLGGLHTLDDLAATSGEFVTPIQSTYRGRQVFQLPPNTQGVVALIILGMLSHKRPADMEFLSAERIHLGIVAARIAYAHRDAWLGDLESSDAILSLIKNDRKLQQLADTISPGATQQDLQPVTAPSSNTVYLSVVDKDRNAASFINSVYHSFGSGICPPGTGVLLQNRGCSFQIDAAHPNAIGPWRRPMHTIIPGMVGHAGKAELSFGVMGGDYQPMGHAHVLSAIYDHGYDLQAACDAPRYMPVGSGVSVESSLGPGVRATLEGWGHQLRTASDPLGGAQLIRIDWDRGVLSAGSDPRKDGCALGY